MPLTPEQKAALIAQLTDAQNQFHLLSTGQGIAQSRDQNGETMSFNIVKLPELAAYIADLQRQLGLTSNRARRPAGVYFGR